MKNLLLLTAILTCTISGFGQRQAAYLDSAYLEIKGNLLHPDTASLLIWSNMDTYSRAFNRFQQNVSVKNNRLVWNIKNGEEIGISKSIYDYIVHALTYMNETNLPSGDYEIRKDKKDGFYYAMLKKVPMKGYRKLSKKELRGNP